MSEPVPSIHGGTHRGQAIDRLILEQFRLLEPLLQHVQARADGLSAQFLLMEQTGVLSVFEIEDELVNQILKGCHLGDYEPAALVDERAFSELSPIEIGDVVV